MRWATIHHLMSIGHGLHSHSLLRVVVRRSWIALRPLRRWRASMVWSHWMSTWAKVTPSLILGALWWAWVTLWPTGKHLRSLSWRFRVWNTSKVRTLGSWAANLLLMTCRARRPCLTFKMCPHGLFIAMVPWRPATGLAHSSPLLFIFSASTFSSFLLTLLTLELRIEVLFLEVVFRQLVSREGGMLLVVSSPTGPLPGHQPRLELFGHGILRLWKPQIGGALSG